MIDVDIADVVVFVLVNAVDVVVVVVVFVVADDDDVVLGVAVVVVVLVVEDDDVAVGVAVVGVMLAFPKSNSVTLKGQVAFSQYSCSHSSP